MSAPGERDDDEAERDSAVAGPDSELPLLLVLSLAFASEALVLLVVQARIISGDTISNGAWTIDAAKDIGAPPTR